MTDERLRNPVKSDYSEALGRVAFTFASLEWQVVWCSEKIKTGSVEKFVKEELTAGQIGKKFIDLTRNMPRSTERETLKTLADRFMVLVEKRNEILHGKPCTGPSGESRLSGASVIEITDLETAADEFVLCSTELNKLSHDFLNSYVP